MFNKVFIHPIRSMYDKVLALSAHPRAVWWLMLVAFTESIFFPIPQDIMLLPMMLANRAKAFFYATMCMIASVLGGIAGYFIGMYLYTQVALPVLELYGYMEKMEALRILYNENGWWIVFGGGFTPVPYKVITISSGAFGMNLGIFIAAAVASRAMRFYLLAILTHYLGDKILVFVDKYFTVLTIVFTFLLVSGFFIIKGVL